MQKKCKNCGKILNIPDDKIPKGKTVVVTCPSCKKKIRIEKKENFFDLDEKNSDIPDLVSDFEGEELIQPKFEDSFSDFKDSGDPFDFIEEEGEMAMLCTEDEALKKGMTDVLEYMDYSVFSPEDNHQALRELRMRGEFSLIVVDESFYCDEISNNAVIRYVKRLPMRDRREIFVFLVSGRRRTFDRKDAFIHSVNAIINTAHLNNFEDLLKKGFAENESFYRNFKEALKKGLKF
ncbi:MAG: hypothetical protein RBR53_04040 [Desulforegulaceae bacterium]|nr:hypothetical protein [Desulforegulaceae bacterium]